MTAENGKDRVKSETGERENGSLLEGANQFFLEWRRVILSMLLIANCFAMRRLQGTPEWTEAGLDRVFEVLVLVSMSAIFVMLLPWLLQRARGWLLQRALDRMLAAANGRGRSSDQR